MTHLQQPSLDLERPCRDAFPCLKVRHGGHVRHVLPELARDCVAHEYPERPCRLRTNRQRSVMAESQYSANPGHSTRLMCTHRGRPGHRVLDLYPLPRHRPVQLPLHLQQVLVHTRVLRKIRVLQNDIGNRLVQKFSFPVRAKLDLRSYGVWEHG